MSNSNWRAKCDMPGHVMVRPYGEGGRQWGLDADEATELRDELTKAIEEAKRLADPFEAWWSGLEQCVNGNPELYRVIDEWVVSKDVARAIWNAAKGS